MYYSSIGTQHIKGGRNMKKDKKEKETNLLTIPSGLSLQLLCH
jgi:hypothetical protein